MRKACVAGADARFKLAAPRCCLGHLGCTPGRALCLPCADNDKVALLRLFKHALGTTSRSDSVMAPCAISAQTTASSFYSGQVSSRTGTNGRRPTSRSPAFLVFFERPAAEVRMRQASSPCRYPTARTCRYLPSGRIPCRRGNGTCWTRGLHPHPSNTYSDQAVNRLDVNLKTWNSRSPSRKPSRMSSSSSSASS